MNKRKWAVILILLALVVVVLQATRSHFREEERNLRVMVRESVQATFPHSYVKSLAGYGLQPYELQNSGKEDQDVKWPVILVHGLDDPGIIWQDLAPALVSRGYRVWIMTYPNDQPIRDSAFFFTEQLQQFVLKFGHAPISVVCHSMGGLVTREMLTNPEIDYKERERSKMLPTLLHFIMVGTPNHGSVFSQFRIVTEIRDQLITATKDGYHWLQAIFDGMGEAGMDLFPDSQFLKELNQRPLPSIARMLVIAGVMGSLEKTELERFATKLQESLPEVARSSLENLLPLLKEMQRGVGDGLVSVESARLEGVPLMQVQGTHVSIIRNFGNNSSRIPPAIPVIINELESLRP